MLLPRALSDRGDSAREVEGGSLLQHLHQIVHAIGPPGLLVPAVDDGAGFLAQWQRHVEDGVDRAERGGASGERGGLVEARVRVEAEDARAIDVVAEVQRHAGARSVAGR